MLQVFLSLRAGPKPPVCDCLNKLARISSHGHQQPKTNKHNFRRAGHPSGLVCQGRTQVPGRMLAREGSGGLCRMRWRCSQVPLAISHGPHLTHTVTKAPSPHTARAQCSDEGDEL